MITQLQFMMLTINSEKAQISAEVKSLQKMRSHLCGHLLHLKQFNQMKILFKLIDSHLLQLQPAEQKQQWTSKCPNLSLYLQANTRIKNHIVRKLHQVQQLISDHRYELYASRTMNCLANIVKSLTNIEWKLEEAERFRREGGKGEKSEALIIEQAP